MEIGLWIAQYSLLAIYGAYGIYKTFWTSNAREKMAWAGDRPENSSALLGLLNFSAQSG